uniref:Uncharacterized protein n=1 Tax=Arundo donax TaxID=35708 RepID=A0A0A9B8W1_ARUDO
MSCRQIPQSTNAVNLSPLFKVPSERHH